MADLIDITLSAGARQPLTIGGKYFRLLNGTGNIDLETENSPKTRVLQGIGFELKSFAWFALTSDTAQTVTVLISDQPTFDNRIAGNVSITAAGSLDVQNPLTVPANAASTVSVAANTSRRALAIRADQANGGPIFLTTSGNRFPLYPGDTFREEITGGVDLDTTQSSDQNAYVYEVV